MQARGYLGIDFGTSNSHFASCCDGAALSFESLTSVGPGGSTSTSILWREPGREPKDIIEIGSDAHEVWSNSEGEEREGLRYSFGFKPDIARSELARCDALGFLTKVRERIEGELPLPLKRGGLHAVIGVPAEIGSRHRRLTEEIARKAGFGVVECVEEPLGALAYHLKMGQILPRQARDGVLVIDFGGGTFDVALTRSSLGLQEPWGDPMLGGRLFDDLFLQWILDQNPGVTISDSEALVAWQKECRELKETFSERWAKAGNDIVLEKLSVMLNDRRLWLRRATVAEFEERARNYRPSIVVRKYFNGLNKRPNGFVDLASIDLFSRIEKAVLGSHSAENLKGRFSKVILTGGSNRWPFMRSLVARLLEIDPRDGVLASSDPERTIGSGLAIYPLLRQQLADRREQIVQEKVEIGRSFAETIDDRFKSFARDLSQDVVELLMPRVEEVFWEWYRRGGSLMAVEARIEEICSEIEESGSIESLVTSHWEFVETDIVAIMRNSLKRFLEDHDLEKDAADYIPENATFTSLATGFEGEFGRDIAAEFGALAEGMTAVALALAGSVLVAVKINVIVLAALANPLVCLLMGFGALLAWAGIAGMAKEFIESWVREHEFNAVSLLFVKLTLRENKFRQKLVAGRNSACEKIREEILDQLRTSSVDEETGEERPAIVEQLNQLFDSLITDAIDDLGILEIAATEGG